MPRRKHRKQPYRVAPGRQAIEIDDRIYELNQLMNGVWPPNATYICSRCCHGGPLAEFKMERDFGIPERRQCLECAKTPRPEPKPPTVSVKPKRPNRAAELAAARIKYQEEQERIKQQQEEDEHFEHYMRMLEEEEKEYNAEKDRAHRELEQRSQEPSPD